jgi:glycosyltransferase involved in cell wall biosynthesis
VKIAVVNWSNRLVGGSERYLQEVLPHLRAAGHEIGFWCETGSPGDRARLQVPDDTPTWCAADLGPDAAIGRLRDWHPDLLYCHGLLDPDIEAATLEVAPAVFFAHSYYGTCTGGPKAHGFPASRPCRKRFGWRCLLHYYPRRCGGWNPGTMAKEHRRQSSRLRILRRYRAIVTHSRYMRDEYLAHGFGTDRVRRVTYLIESGSDASPAPDDPHGPRRQTDDANPRRAERWCLLFVGRMDRLKGGRLLLDALPTAAERLTRPIHAIFLGDGPERHRWETYARSVAARAPVSTEFTGWRHGVEFESTVRRGHLLVVPSLWPEPFGRVGVEVGRFGIPAAAFDVGGISEWLEDGVSGALAPGDPPTMPGLAEAICRCLADAQILGRLGEGAAERARDFTAPWHLADLEPILEQAAHGR